MIETGGGVGLTEEPAAGSVVRRLRRGKELQRDPAIELQILSEIHFAHSPLANLGENPIV
jgi:hypothetical protein